jgi:1-acyl-sn-glycerol-3-phosphate acyltransferase
MALRDEANRPARVQLPLALGPCRMLVSPRRGRAEPVSEAMLDRPMGGAEATLGADALGAAEPVRELVPQGPGDLAAQSGQPPNPHRRRHMDEATAIRNLPRGDLSEFQRSFRHWFSRVLAKSVMKTWFRISVVNPDGFLREPGLYTFNHMSWMDTLLVIAVMPVQPRVYMYGPKQADIRSGGRNRFMWWTGIPIPFSPDKDDIRTSVKRAQAVFDSGGVLAIAAEGAIHVHEGDLMPFEEGAAYLALRAGVPIVPMAITGTSWAHFRGRILVRFGEPIQTEGRPTREAVARYTALAWHALRAMVSNDRDLRPPGPIERWFTDMFNDWGPGGRAAATLRRGPDPADVPYGPGSVSAE